MVLMLAIFTLLTSETVALTDGEKLSPEAKARAAQAFKEGQALFAHGEYLEAAAAFERAYRLAPHPAALANIGFCYDEVGDYPRAVSAFRKYMKQPNPQAPQDTVKISTYLDNMKSKVGDLAIRCSLASCEVIVDNMPRGVTPTNLVLLAGEHSVDVVAVDGGPRRHYNITVPQGRELVLDAVLTGEPAEPRDAPATAAPKTEKKPIRLRAPFWVATSATVVGLGAVAVLVGLNHTNMQDFKAGDSSDPALLQRGNQLTLGTNIAIGLSVAAATTAIILAIIDVKQSRDKSREIHQEARRSRFLNMTFSGSELVFTFRGLRK